MRKIHEKSEIQDDLQCELLRAKIRNVNAQADKTEFKTKITQGEYVRISDVKKKWAQDVSNIKAKLLGLHVKLAPELANVSAREASNIVKAGIIDALQELAASYEDE